MNNVIAFFPMNCRRKIHSSVIVVRRIAGIAFSIICIIEIILLGEQWHQKEQLIRTY